MIFMHNYQVFWKSNLHGFKKGDNARELSCFSEDVLRRSVKFTIERYYEWLHDERQDNVDYSWMHAMFNANSAEIAYSVT